MVKYIIQPGDSLHNIALRFKTSINNIMSANMIFNPYDIYPGQLMYIPANRYYSKTITANFPLDSLPIQKRQSLIPHLFVLEWYYPVYWFYWPYLKIPTEPGTQ